MIAVSDYAGHYAPLVPLGWALQAAGHDVRLVCGPAHAPAAARTGLPVVPLGTDVDTVLRARIGNHLDALDGRPRHPGLPPIHPLTGEPMTSLDGFDWAEHAPAYLGRMAVDGRDRTRAVAGFARTWGPDLVLYDLLSPEGLVAAHAAGVPAICHLWGPTGTEETGPGLDRLRPDIPAPVRERLGIDAGIDLVRYVLDPCPPALAPATRARRIPVRYTPYSGPGLAAPALEPPTRPRIVVVWSTSLTRIFGPASFLVPAAVQAAAGLDAGTAGPDVVVAVGDADAARLGQVPPGVRVLRGHPLSSLLRDASAVVHHGGAGCLMTAVAAGVPQLALPFGAEQEMIATRLAAAGAGRVIRGSAADAAGIAAALRALLDDPGHARAARALAAQNAAAPSPAEAVDAVRAIAHRTDSAVPAGTPA